MQWEDRIGRRLKLRDVHILLATVQCGSMTRAAESLAISHPVVSKTIADLERTLGVRLLERSRQGVEPTPYGRSLLAHGLAAFDELRQCVKEIEFLTDPTVGEVRVAGTEAIVAGLLPVVVERLCKRYPRLTVHITQVISTPSLYQGLRERTVDCVIGRTFGRKIEKDLKAEILFDEHPVVVAGLQNRWVSRRKIELAELVNEPWVFPQPDSAAGSAVIDTFHACGLDVPRAAVITNSIHTNNALAASGHFLVMHPHSLAKLGAKQSPLKILPVKLSPQRGPVGIVTLRNRTISPVAQLFMDCVREVARPLAPQRSGH